jgi:hypothetical protein
MTEHSEANWSFPSKKDEEAWLELLARFERSVVLHCAPLDQLDFKACGLEHHHRNELRDYTASFAFTKGTLGIEIQMAAVGLYLRVILMRFAVPARCGHQAHPTSVLDLEAELLSHPDCRLEKPAWLKHSTLGVAAQKMPQRRFVDLVRKHTDDCVKLLVDRLLHHGHLLVPELPAVGQ